MGDYSNFTLHRQPKIVTDGFVGVPREGEEVCSACNGTGHDPEFPRDRFGGCDICEGTGVRPVSNPSNEWKGNQIDEL
jgi:DnaJ-class molecular chaperone